MTEDILNKQSIIAALKARLNGKEARLNAALLIAASALLNKTDRYGNDYAPHYLRVAFDGTLSNTKRIIGILHDVVEDSDWTLDDLREVGFSERIVRGVDSVTKKPEEKYFDFIERNSTCDDGIDVKIKDLRDNTSLTRNEALMNAREITKSQVYIISYQYLVAVKKKEISPNTRMTEFLASRPQLYDAELLREFSSHPVGP